MGTKVTPDGRNAFFLKYTPISNTEPTDGQVLVYQEEVDKYVPSTISSQGAETDPLSVHLDQSTPQTIVNGIPLLDQVNGSFNNPLQIVNKQYIDKRVRGGGGFIAPVFFRTDDSDIAGYKRISYVNQEIATEIPRTINAGMGAVECAIYLYDEPLATVLLDPGIYTANYRVKVSKSISETQLIFTAFVREVDGTIRDLFTSYSKDIDNLEYETLRSESNEPSFTVNTTDRFGVKICAVTTSNADVIITTVVGGEYGSYFSTPIALRHSLLRGRDSLDQHPLSAITNLNDVVKDDGSVVATELTVGNDTDYTEIETNGTLRMYGEATVFKDELQSLLVQLKNNPADQLVLNIAEGTLDFKDTATLTDYAAMNVQINHDWKIGSTVFPHIHWFQNQAQTPNWLIQYRWQSNGGLKDTTWKNYPLDINVFTDPGAGETKIQISHNDSGITPPVGAGLSDILQLRIIRDTDNDSGEFTGVDNYTGLAPAINVDVHFEINSIGSNEEYVK